MSSQVYSLLKNTRKDKDLSLAFVASKTGISESTLHVIETGEIETLDIPSHTIEAYITRYGEFLGLKKLPNYTLPPRPRERSNLTVLDYMIRLAMIIIISLLVYHVFVLIKTSLLVDSKVYKVNTENQSIVTDKPNAHDTGEKTSFIGIKKEQNSPENPVNHKTFDDDHIQKLIMPNTLDTTDTTKKDQPEIEKNDQSLTTTTELSEPWQEAMQNAIENSKALKPDHNI
ncbi:helix-turn-helix domain-containing protein [Thiotrichales bacterium 19S9-12]|nr:helix-turn-helix domain-containing protein [Thiotrichales bacterium 19S9-11]MCF6810854.1 helix-turn-helix domain-containing protein [Thiotrichales bacterium 19S9-12]